MYLPLSHAVDCPESSIRGNPESRQCSSWLMRWVAVALIVLMQGPAMLVQEVAWTRMLVTYTLDRGLSRGVVETFNGEHPCELCKRASRMRVNEERRDPMERRNESIAIRFSWSEMVTASLLILPVVPGRELIVPVSPWIGHSSGRGADGPVTPPPERV